MNILEAINAKYTSAKFDADADTTSIKDVYKVTFYYVGTHKVQDYIYITARWADECLITAEH